eukprot:COSAG01_NODE_8319_length_2831_cov_3.274890_1_plen_42_part_00
MIVYGSGADAIICDCDASSVCRLRVAEQVALEPSPSSVAYT